MATWASATQHLQRVKLPLEGRRPLCVCLQLLNPSQGLHGGGSKECHLSIPNSSTEYQRHSDTRPSTHAAPPPDRPSKRAHCQLGTCAHCVLQLLYHLNQGIIGSCSSFLQHGDVGFQVLRPAGLLPACTAWHRRVASLVAEEVAGVSHQSRLGCCTLVFARGSYHPDGVCSALL